MGNGMLGDICTLDTDCSANYVCLQGVCSTNTTGFKATSTVYIAAAVVVGVIAIFVISLVTFLCIRRRKRMERRAEEQNTYNFEHQPQFGQRPGTAAQGQGQGMGMGMGGASVSAYQHQPWGSPATQVGTPAPLYGSPAPPYGAPSPITPVAGDPIELDTVEKPVGTYYEMPGDESWSPLGDNGEKRKSRLVGTKSTRKSSR